MIKILTRDYLATYTYLESEIKRIRRRIKHYEDNPVQQVCGVVKGSMQQFPFTECHFVVSGATVKSTEERDKTIRQLLIDLKGNEQLFEDMKLEEIARVTNTNLNTVKSRLYKSLRRLRELTEEEC